MLFELRLRLSYYLLQLGVWVIPDEHTKMVVSEGLIAAGKQLERDLMDESL